MSPFLWVALIGGSLVATILAALLWSVRHLDPINTADWPIKEDDK